MHQCLQVAHQVLLPPHCLGHPQTMLTTGRDTPSCALALQQLKPSRAAALRQLARVHAVLLRPSSSQPLTACQDCHTWQVRLCTDAVNSVVQHTVNSAAYHALHWGCCTLDVSIVAVTLLSRLELWCDSGCCELQSKPCVVPAGHCNAEIQAYIAYHVSTLTGAALMVVARYLHVVVTVAVVVVVMMMVLLEVVVVLSASCAANRCLTTRVAASPLQWLLLPAFHLQALNRVSCHAYIQSVCEYHKSMVQHMTDKQCC